LIFDHCFVACSTKTAAITVRVLRHWYRLLGEVVDGLFLETFEIWLDGTLSNLI